MAFTAFINTLTLMCLVLFGLWILSHLAEAIRLFVMARAYQRHHKVVFTIPFVPLQTRLFHDLAVPQYLASEAIQGGDLPLPRPAPSAPASTSLPLTASLTDRIGPGVAPAMLELGSGKAAASSLSSSSSMLSSKSPLPAGTLLAGLTDSVEDSSGSSFSKRRKALKQKAPQTPANVSGSVATPPAAPAAAAATVTTAKTAKRAKADEPIAVTVKPAAATSTPLQPSAATNATPSEASNPSWWTSKLEGKDLVLGLQLPLTLLPTASTSLMAKLEGSTLKGAPMAALKAKDSRDRSSGRISPSKTSPTGRHSKGGGSASSVFAKTTSNAGNGGPLATTYRQPTVSLQLKTYKLTSSSLLATMGAPGSVAGCASGGGAFHTFPRAGAFPQGVPLNNVGHQHAHNRLASGTSLQQQQQTQLAIAQQLAVVPIQVCMPAPQGRQSGADVPLCATMSLPRPSSYHGSVPASIASPSLIQNSRDVLDFDTIKYAYVHYYQSLLEVAVAEQTALAHRGQHDRKSAKRVRRIVGLLMQYFQYTNVDADNHAAGDEEDEQLTAGNDSFLSQHTDASMNGGGNTLTRNGSRSSSTASVNATSLNNSLTEGGRGGGRRPNALRRLCRGSPWVPLLADRRDEPACSAGERLASPLSPTPQRHATSFAARNPSFTLPLPIAAPPSTQLQKHGHVYNTTTATPVRETRRSGRHRREAPADIADSDIEALEALVERIRLAQTLRRRYQSLVCAVNFRAERFVVRRGAAGAPTWSVLNALPTDSGGGSGTVQRNAGDARGPVESASSQSGGSPLTTPQGSGVYPPRLQHPSSVNDNVTDSGVWTSPSPSDTFSAVADYGGGGSGNENGSRTFLVDVPNQPWHSHGQCRLRQKDSGKEYPLREDATQPPSSEPSTALFLARGGTAVFTDESRVLADEFATPSSSFDATTLEGGSDASLGAKAHLSAPPLGTGSFAFAAAAAPLPGAVVSGSTSANNAAMEFLRASRQHCSNRTNHHRRRTETKREGITPLSSEDPSWPSSQLSRPSISEAGTGNNWNSTLNGAWRSSGIERRVLSDSDPGSQLESTTRRQAHNAGESNGTSDGDAACSSASQTLTAFGTPKAVSKNASENQRAAASSAVTPGELNLTTATTSATNAGAAASAAGFAPPHGTDMRLVYIIGADRATLLRSLTLKATRTFSSGTQNFLCFFTRGDERRARRRYMEEMDRQYRLELQHRMQQRSAATALASSGPESSRLAASSSPAQQQQQEQHRHHDTDNTSSDDRDHMTEVLESYRMSPPPPFPLIPTSRTSSTLRHGRTTSWHAVGMGGSGAYKSDTFEKDTSSKSDRDDGEALLPSSSSLYSMTGDGAAPAAASAAPSKAVMVCARPVNVHVPDRSTGAKVSPQNLEHSLYSRSDLRSSNSVAKTASAYTAIGVDPVGTHELASAQSLASSSASSMASMEGSFASLHSRKESTVVLAAEERRDLFNYFDSHPTEAQVSPPTVKHHTEIRDDGGLGSTLRSSTDSVFAVSLHSLSSVEGSHVSNEGAHTVQQRRCVAPRDSRSRSQLQNETSKSHASTTAAVEPAHQHAKTNTASSVDKAAAATATDRELPSRPSDATNRDEKDVEKVDAKAQAENSPLTSKGSKKALKAAAAASTTAATTAEETSPNDLIRSPLRFAPQHCAPLELPDTVPDHDVGSYHAAVGVTLPEQAFLLQHDAQHEPTSSPSPSAGHGHPARGSTPSRRAGAHNANLSAVPLPSYRSGTPPAMASSGNSCGKRVSFVPDVTRVLEGQVEVAELSLDVLRRQLKPFVPPKVPSFASSDDVVEEEEAENSPDESDDSTANSSSFSSAMYSAGDSDSSERGGKRNKASHRKRTDRRKKKSTGKTGKHEAKAKGRKEKKGTRGREHTSQRSGGHSRRSNRRYRCLSDDSSRRRRRQRQRQRLRQLTRRLYRKRVAAMKAGFTPVSVGALFFTAPPELPALLKQRMQAQRAAQVGGRLLVPAWALGDAHDGNEGSLLLDKTASSLQDSPHQLPQQHQPCICVTLIYTSTAEQLAQTLLRAGELVASAKAKRRAVAAATANARRHASSESYPYLPDSSVFRRGSWNTNVLNNSMDLLGRSSSINVSGNYGSEVGMPRRTDSHHRTATPSPNDSFGTYLPQQQRRESPNLRYRNTPPESLKSSMNLFPTPPRVNSGTATFTGDDAGSFPCERESRDAHHSSKSRTSQMKADVSSDNNSNHRSASVGVSGSAGSNSQGGGDTADGGLAGSAKAAVAAPPPPPLLLLSASTDSLHAFGTDVHANKDSTLGGGSPAGHIEHTSTSIFEDSRYGGDGNTSRRRDETHLGQHSDNDIAGGRIPANNAGGGKDAWATPSSPTAATVTDDLVDVLRDSTAFPSGVPVGVSLTYLRVGNDLYAVTEVVDRTFLQYREERVIQPHARDKNNANNKNDAANGNDNTDGDALSSGGSTSLSDVGDDAESGNGYPGFSNNTSFGSDTPFTSLDAALEAIQSQHEATARQQRQRLHHRRRAVSTMEFGDLSYSLSGAAPVRNGMRRQEVHMCWRCLSAEATIIFLPCGHYAVCEDCGELLADCCVCKTPILSSVILLQRQRPRASSPKKHQQQQHRRSPASSSPLRHQSPRH